MADAGGEAMIVGLCGYARSGKNTLANLIDRHYNTQQIAFADALRNVLYATDPMLHEDGTRVSDAVEEFGYDGVKETKYGQEFRRLLQNLGTQGVRDNISDTAWVDIVLNKISAGGDWTVTDCRFPNEVEAVRNAGGILLWVSRPGVAPANSHASENIVSSEDCDYIVYNHGTESDMMRQVKEIINFHSSFEEKP